MHRDTTRQGFVRLPAKCNGKIAPPGELMDNAQLFRTIIERGFNLGDLTVADEVCAARLSEHEYLSPTHLSGPEILKAQIRAAREALHGLHLVIEDIVVDGDKVWARSRATGKSSRTNVTVAIDVFDICRFKEGRLVEHWGVADRFALLHQSGALPPRPSP